MSERERDDNLWLDFLYIIFIFKERETVAYILLDLLD